MVAPDEEIIWNGKDRLIKGLSASGGTKIHGTWANERRMAATKGRSIEAALCWLPARLVSPAETKRNGRFRRGPPSFHETLQFDFILATCESHLGTVQEVAHFC